jgi:hypothetical protein
MLTNASLTLDPSILPQVRGFSNLNRSNIFKFGRMSKPLIADSLPQVGHMFRYGKTIAGKWVLKKPVLLAKYSQLFEPP